MPVWSGLVARCNWFCTSWMLKERQVAVVGKDNDDITGEFVY
jgi:hypothetical protein